MKLAMPNPQGAVFELSRELREEGLAESRANPRRRMLLPIHRRQEAIVQRMVNFLQPGTYIQPHLHPRNWASETLHVMSGAIGFVTFDEHGEVRTTSRLGVGGLVDIEARVWHGVVALEEDTIILEIKRGPYDDSDKVFAEWAPEESAPAMAAYRDWLESLFSEVGGESISPTGAKT